MKISYTICLAAIAAAPLAAAQPKAGSAAKTEPAKAEPAPAAHPMAMYTPADMKWGDAPPIFPKGAKLSVLTGDPFKEGYYALRMKMPAGYKVMPHTHSKDENVTVISGDFAGGMGEKFDEKKSKSFGAGSFVQMPAGMAHFGFTKGGTELEVSGNGPFTMTYINPADDPSKAAAPAKK